MPTPTYTALATLTLSSSASSVTFSSIPATYRDLVLVISGTTTTDKDIWARFNGDTGTNYSGVRMLGNGSSTVSDSQTGQTFADLGGMTTTQSDAIVNIMDYSATDKHKTTVHRNNKGAAYTLARANRWASTSAITSVAVIASTGLFGSGSTFSLYGIAS